MTKWDNILKYIWNIYGFVYVYTHVYTPYSQKAKISNIYLKEKDLKMKYTKLVLGNLVTTDDDVFLKYTYYLYFSIICILST